MWMYEQRTGGLYLPVSPEQTYPIPPLARLVTRIATGYAGHGIGKNNPDLQSQVCVGPLPVGLYAIGEPRDLKGGLHGPFVLPLTPSPNNRMYGRSGFLIHADSIALPGTASQGCIILDYPTRKRIADSGIRVLLVFRELVTELRS